MRKYLFYSLIVITILSILTFFFNFPLFKDFSKRILGPSMGDNIGTVGDFWWTKYAFANNLNPEKIILINYPFSLNKKGDLKYPLWNKIIHFLLSKFDEIAVFNFVMLISFILAGLSIFWLTFYITKDFFSSLLSSIIFSFSPYHFSHSWVQITLAHIECIPFFFLGLFLFIKNMNYKSSLLFALATLLVIATDYYYTYIIFLTGILSCFYILIKRKEISFRIKKEPVLLSLLLILIGGFFLTLSVWKNFLGIERGEFFQQTAKRPFKHLLELSAHPLNYILFNLWHPIFGKVTHLFFDTKLYGGNDIEHGSLYLGISVLFLCFIGLRRGKFPQKLKFYKNFFIFLAISGIILSFPPYWDFKVFKIYFPSFFLYKLFSMFRAYTRFGVIVIMSVAVLGGMSLHLILKNKSVKKKIIYTLGGVSLVLFDFLNFPPFHYRDVSKIPPVYEWLSKQRGNFAIAEYPLEDINASSTTEYSLWQRIHKKPLVNGAPPLKNEFSYRVMRVISDLEYPQTLNILKGLGVKYIIVHTAQYMQQENLFLPSLEKYKGLKLVKDFGKDKVYLITASSKEVDFKDYEVWRQRKIRKISEFLKSKVTIPKLKKVTFRPKIYRYKITYLKIIPLGELVVKISTPKIYKNSNIYEISAEVKFPKLLNFIFKNLKAEAFTLIDKEKFSPHYFEGVLFYFNEKEKIIVHYDQEKHLIKIKEKIQEAPPYVQNPLSLLLFLPANNFKEETQRFYFNAGKRNYFLEIKKVSERNSVLLLECKVEKPEVVKKKRLKARLLIKIKNSDLPISTKMLTFLGPVELFQKNLK